MKKILDYTGVYKAKADEKVIRANILFFSKDDLKGFDGAVAFDRYKTLLKDVKNVSFVKTPTKDKKIDQDIASVEA